jgi:hypothetical protein
MTIEYYTKQVYGIDRMYVVGDKAFEFEVITKEKTLSLPKMDSFRLLGIEFKEVLPPKS